MASQGAGFLAYAVRGTAVLRLGGELCRSLVGVALVPALFAVADGEWVFAGRCAAVAALLMLAGYAAMRLPEVKRLQSNEAMVTVALAYLVTALLMSWPLMSSGLAPVDAVFHSISGITTTGLTTISSVEGMPPAFLFAQAWLQWYGGLAVVVLALLLMGPGPEAQRLSDVNREDGDLVAGTRLRARQAFIVYSLLTAAGFVLLLVLGCSWFDALVHTLSAISTGGFSSHAASLAALGGWPVQAGVMLLSLAGAIALVRYRALAPGAPGVVARLRGFFDGETRMLLALCAVVSLLLAFTMASHLGLGWREAVRTAPLLAVSAQSTAGFTPVEVSGLDAASKILIVFAMFIGGGLGSTAGGIKVFRFAVLLRAAALAMLRTHLPAHAVVKFRVAGRPIDEAGLAQAMGVVACYVAVTFVSWYAFVLYGYDALDSLFEVVSATATVGLSAGISSPSLEAGLKLVLCADMWVGRLEVLAVLILLSRHTWIGRRAGST